MDNIETKTTDQQVAVAPVTTPLAIVLGAEITKVEFNGKEAESMEDKVLFIRQYLRNQILAKFGLSEVEKNPITAGKLYFNVGNSTKLKLPKVTERENGSFAETPQVYYNRVKPLITKWLVQSFQNSGITMEQVGALA